MRRWWYPQVRSSTRRSTQMEITNTAMCVFHPSTSTSSPTRVSCRRVNGETSGYNSHPVGSITWFTTRSLICCCFGDRSLLLLLLKVLLQQPDRRRPHSLLVYNYLTLVGRNLKFISLSGEYHFMLIDHWLWILSHYFHSSIIISNHLYWSNITISWIDHVLLLLYILPFCDYWNPLTGQGLKVGDNRFLRHLPIFEYHSLFWVPKRVGI